MPSLLLRPTKVVKISGQANNFNLFSNVSATYPLNVICLVDANVGSNSNTTPAFVTGNGWSTGTWIFIDNNATIRGANGSNGATGSRGANGAGGAGGAASSSGSPGGPAANGSPGANGSTGGIAFRADIISGVTISLDNSGGAIIMGSGGSGGQGGPGGLGGGGGGGGGGN